MTEDKSKFEKLNISILKYFWQSSPLYRSSGDNIPQFLRKIEALKNFTDNELRVLSSYLHQREYAPNEQIFKQYDQGIGFYFIFQGDVEIYNEATISIHPTQTTEIESEKNGIAELTKYNYFGELALLQEKAVRTASARAISSCTLFGIFRPDLEEMINNDATVASKLLQSISLILADRISFLAREFSYYKQKVEKGG